MKFLVVGKGGREHAIVKALVRSTSVEKVYALPGSAGISLDAEVIATNMNAEAVYKAVSEFSIDVVVIGPEDPLVAGMADSLRAQGVQVFGPDRAGALLEGSKVRSKEFMNKYNIPTAHSVVVKTVREAMKQAEGFTPPYVLKADGLAAGKGVFICKTLEELESSSRDIFEVKTLGEAGSCALLEQFQPGYELSYFVLTNGKEFVSLPMAQDHKKLLDGDEGPNTGGMGTVAPMKIDQKLEKIILEKIVEPTIEGLKNENFDYRGVVFIGLMMTDSGPQVLEYNVRFGDPETQVLLPLMTGDWGEAFAGIAQGNIPSLQWGDRAAACVVLAAENYPASPVKGTEIAGLSAENTESQYVLHAGTQLVEGKWQTNGGRVLNAIGMAENLKSAIGNAYECAEKINWPGRQMRKDIGKGITK